MCKDSKFDCGGEGLDNIVCLRVTICNSMFYLNMRVLGYNQWILNVGCFNRRGYGAGQS